ncbi:phosphoglycolate phosphatase [Devosia sp. UYZn731]|uniref:HAD-IA family hydrolase n=1 Tax=Devosia sp. UYZn731 TaxID=3156345 RepID=UPI00339A8350
MILVMFDMDGTLIDTQALITEHMAATFAGAGLAAPVPEESRRVIGLSLPVALGRLAKSDDAGLIERLVESYKSHYRASVVTDEGREGLFPGALSALERLRLWPDTQLGIATGKGLNGVHRILGLHGIEDYFVTLQTPDHNPSKPHPGMMYRAMSETGASAEQTVMVGDTTFDIEMGKAAGAKAIAVSWGYHETAEMLEAGADAVIDRYEDLDAAIRTVLELSDA